MGCQHSFMVIKTKTFNEQASVSGLLFGMFTAGWFGGDKTIVEVGKRKCQLCGIEKIYYRKALSGAHIDNPFSEWKYDHDEKYKSII